MNLFIYTNYLALGFFIISVYLIFAINTSMRLSEITEARYHRQPSKLDVYINGKLSSEPRHHNLSLEQAKDYVANMIISSAKSGVGVDHI